MIGDQADFQQRLRSLLPKSWFPVHNSPNLDASLQGSAWALSSIYSQITYATLQTRIKTATDGWLDIISGDFFGVTLPRITNESDVQFRARILANLFVKGPRRGDMSRVLTLITGRTPVIFEPSNTSDSMGYDGGAYYDISTAGAYGDPLPYQAFITVYRPNSGQLSALGYYDSFLASFDSYGAYSESSGFPDSILIAAVEATKPVGTLIWMRILANPIQSPSFSSTPVDSVIVGVTPIGLTQYPV